MTSEMSGQTPKSKKSTALLFVVVGLALAGGGVSGKLLVDHDGGWQTAGAANGPLWGLCKSTAAAGASCPDVVGSRWGSFDFTLGARTIVIPTSFVGLAYFVSAAIWFAVHGLIDGSRRWLWAITLAYLSCGLASSLFLTGVMTFTLQQWCPLCAMPHTINAALFAVTLVMWGCVQRPEEPVSSSPRVVPRLVDWSQARKSCTALVTAIVATGGMWAYYDAAREARRQFSKVAAYREMLTALQDDAALMLREFYAQPLLDTTLEKPNPTDGPAKAVPSLLVFEDVGCRACRCFDRLWSRHFSRPFTDGVEVSRRWSPVAGTGRPRASDGRTDTTVDRYVIEAAGLQGGERARLRMSDLLHRNRKQGPGQDYARLAEKCGLHVERFLSDLRGQEVRRIVEEDSALARRLRVTSTPAVFLNGRRVPDVCLSSRVFWSAVADDLQRRNTLASAQPGTVSR